MEFDYEINRGKLKHMNHSRQFWNLVEKYMPDYKKAENELKY